MNNVDEAPVILCVPNDPSFLRIVRLVVASIASDLGFDFDEVEDLRIAADELVNLVMSASVPHSSIRVEIFLESHRMLLRASGSVSNQAAAQELDPLAAQIVSALVESFDVAVVDGRLEVGFRARPPVRSTGG